MAAGALVGDDDVNAVNKHTGKTALDIAMHRNPVAVHGNAEFAAVLRDELGGKREEDLW